MLPMPEPNDSEMLQLLLNDSPDLIYFKDLQSRFIRGSRALCRYLDISQEQLVGKSDFDFFAPERVNPHFEEEQEIIRTGQPMIGRMEENIGKDGRRWWVLTSKAAIRGKAGNVIGTFGISKDITDLKNAEVALEESRKHLLEVSKRAGKAEVAAEILHNAGNVLNSVGVSVEIIHSQIKKSKVNNIGKVVSLLDGHDHLTAFLNNDVKGKQAFEYLRNLAQFLTEEQGSLLNEVEVLLNHLGTIKQIVVEHRKYTNNNGF